MNTEKQLFIELAAKTKSGQMTRNHIIPFDQKEVDAFAKKFDYTDIFRSIYLFDNKNIRNAVLQGPFMFDLDGKEAIIDTRSAIGFLTDKGCPKETIRLYFSGAKGFHLEIPFAALKIEPDTKLNKYFEIIAKEIKGAIPAPSLDTAIYDNVRVFRLPNTINSKSGLYKIPISFEELALDIEAIKKLAVSPRPDFNFSDPSEWKEFTAIYEKAKSRLSHPKQRNGVLSEVEIGARHSMTFKRAIRLKAEGKTLDEAIAICREIPDSPPLEDEELVSTISDAFKDIYVVTKPKSAKTDKDATEYTSFRIANGVAYEEIIDPILKEPIFVQYDGQNIGYAASFTHNGKLILPISDPVITSGSLVLPDGVDEYGSEAELVGEITELTHKNADAGKMEIIIPYYILLSWIYDLLPVFPYLSILGPSDSGKTRLLTTIGYLLYKPFFCSGSVTSSPIFRTLDLFKGSLVLNEFDFAGDYNQELVVILNNGFEPKMSVIRTIGQEEKSVKAFSVFGPKIFSSRKRKNDWAFESRTICIPMKETKRRDISPFLDDRYHVQADRLRRKLLLFRLRHILHPIKINYDLFPDVSGRLRQILLCMAAVSNDPKYLKVLNDFARDQKKQLTQVRAMEIDAVVYREICAMKQEGTSPIYLKDLTEKVKATMGYDRLAIQTVGASVRDELGLEIKRAGPKGANAVYPTDDQLEELKKRYEPDTSEIPSVTSVSSVTFSPNEPINQAKSTPTEVTEVTELQGHDNDEIRKLEKEFREKTRGYDKKSKEYSDAWSKWRLYRNEGVNRGIFQFFTPQTSEG
jgi:hypothetical protein